MASPEEAIEARIAAASQAADQVRVVTVQIGVAEQQVQAEDATIADLVARLGVEEHDVERLERLTWTRILATARGGRGDSLTRERAQRDALKLQVTQAQDRRASLQHEREALTARNRYLTTAAEDRAVALADLDRLQAAVGDPAATARVAAADELGTIRARRQQIDEAVVAARVALSRLDRVDDRLSSAHGWSTYDTWFGGGAIASAVKHQRLDEAAAASAAVGLALRGLRREMADIDVRDLHYLDGVLSFGSDQRFFDIWLDNIFTDFSVSRRISQAQTISAETREKVGAVVSMLEERVEAIAARELELERVRDAR